MATIIHKHSVKNMRKLTRNEEADCTTCEFAEKSRTVDGVDEYVCKAALYDIKTLSCYVRRENNTNNTNRIEKQSKTTFGKQSL